MQARFEAIGREPHRIGSGLVDARDAKLPAPRSLGVHGERDDVSGAETRPGRQLARHQNRRRIRGESGRGDGQRRQRDHEP